MKDELALYTCRECGNNAVTKEVVAHPWFRCPCSRPSVAEYAIVDVDMHEIEAELFFPDHYGDSLHRPTVEPAVDETAATHVVLNRDHVAMDYIIDGVKDSNLHIDMTEDELGGLVEYILRHEYLHVYGE